MRKPNRKKGPSLAARLEPWRRPVAYSTVIKVLANLASHLASDGHDGSEAPTCKRCAAVRRADDIIARSKVKVS